MLSSPPWPASKLLRPSRRKERMRRSCFESCGLGELRGAWGSEVDLCDFDKSKR